MGALQPRLGGNAAAGTSSATPQRSAASNARNWPPKWWAAASGTSWRCRWSVATGTTSPGTWTRRSKSSTPLRSKFPILASQTAAEAAFILGKAMMAQGNDTESLQILEEAATLFDTAAATERSATVREYPRIRQAPTAVSSGGISVRSNDGSRSPRSQKPGHVQSSDGCRRCLHSAAGSGRQGRAAPGARPERGRGRPVAPADSVSWPETGGSPSYLNSPEWRP